MTSSGSGRPTAQYAGMSRDISRRLDEHGRGGPDNIARQINQAADRGMDVRVRYASADNPLEARAQELHLLDQRDYNWNAQNNDGKDNFWYRKNSNQ